MKVIFCMQIKYQTILQVDTINFGGHGQAMPVKLLRVTSLQKLCNTSRNKGRIKFIFIAMSIAIFFK